MPDSTLYDDDILLWSEEQAELIRRLGATRRNLPNALDIENVAEEIESVGRSELASVESCIELILLHLIKLAAGGQHDAARHWRAEIVAFHGNMRRRYTPSMRQRIDIDGLWRLARRQVVLRSDTPDAVSAWLPTTSPFSLAEILDTEISFDRILRQLPPAPGQSH